MNKIKKYAKILLFLICSFSSILQAFSQSLPSTQDLLNGYIKNDLSLKKYLSLVKSKEVDNSYVNKEQGINFTIQSGTITYNSGKNYISLEPEAQIVIPETGNLTFTTSSSIELQTTDKTKNISDTSFNFEADLFSGNNKTRKITLMESQREILEAKRNLEDGFISCEKDFYEELESIFETALNLVTSQKDLYDDQIEFEQIKAQGYSSASSKYRTANMEVISDSRTVQKYEHELERNTKIFAKECGFEYSGNNALLFLPSIMPEVKEINILDFNKEDYTKLEEACWQKKIDTLKKDSYNFLTLTGNAGYTIKNSSTNNSDTYDIGTGLKLGETGLCLSALTSIPVDNNKQSYSFGFSIDPLAFFKYSTTLKQYDLTLDQDQIEIESALNDYDTDVVSQQTSLSDILWAKQQDKESYEMYSEMNEEYETWFTKGIITESELKNVQANKEKYRIQCIIDDIELIIYNDTTNLLFYRQVKQDN